MITAIYPDKAESLPTPEVCAELKKDVPVITRVSVKRTNQENGVDTISWAKPTELDDSVQFTPPYFYKVYRSAKGEQEQLINNIGPFFNILDGDTLMVDSGINTPSKPISIQGRVRK